MTIDLAGKTALITGASRGIGRGIALGYARAGADLALAARDEQKLAEVAQEVEALGRRALVLPTDVTDGEACRRLVDDAVAGLGVLDVLVNNAGGSSYLGPFTELRFSGWEKVMRLNVDSVVHLCQAAGRHMLERGSGSIVNVASVAALHGTPGLSPYGASKAAVLSLTRSLAVEWGSRGVRVNALCPGWTRTDLNSAMWSNPDTERALVAGTPLARWADVEEMVGPALFLASDAASYYTGQALVVDGGQTAT
jgi:NAD(P)-dependent dehydrogenase (short-subunit alcohol dehydrogenase family)